VCQVDTPCKHQVENNRLKAWVAGFNPSGKYYDQREEVYGEFLRSGDFETWQKFCYMDQNTEEYRLGAIAAQREFMRALWILNRFNTFQSPAWYRMGDKVLNNFRVLKQMIESNEKRIYWDEELNGK
jgi:hypothetical protein